MKSPRVKDKEARIKEIQIAARKVFFEKGYQDATIEEVAKVAAIAKGTVYLYFRNKDDLYISLMEPVTKLIGEKLRGLQADMDKKRVKSCQEVIQAIFGIFCSAYDYDAEGIRVVQAFQQGNYFSGMATENVERLNHIARDNYRLARRIISKAVKLGLFQKLKPMQLTDLLWGLFIGIIQLEESKLRATKKNHLHDMLEFAISIMTDVLCRTQTSEERRKIDQNATDVNNSEKAGK